VLLGAAPTSSTGPCGLTRATGCLAAEWALCSRHSPDDRAELRARPSKKGSDESVLRLGTEDPRARRATRPRGLRGMRWLADLGPPETCMGAHAISIGARARAASSERRNRHGCSRAIEVRSVAAHRFGSGMGQTPRTGVAAPCASRQRGRRSGGRGGYESPRSSNSIASAQPWRHRRGPARPLELGYGGRGAGARVP
jgi:hypothetical protein